MYSMPYIIKIHSNHGPIGRSFFIYGLTGPNMQPLKNLEFFVLTILNRYIIRCRFNVNNVYIRVYYQKAGNM